MPVRALSIDFETACLADLKKSGASRYSRDPSLIVTVLAWAFDDEPVKSVTHKYMNGALPPEIVSHIKSGGIVRGWNASSFELNILINHFGVDVSPEQIDDTMQSALHAGLPGALGDCGPALRLPIIKDATAHRLMLQMARPRKIEADGSIRWWHDEDPEKLEALRKYCEQDVRAEREIAKNIPPLPAREKKVSELDRRANMRGVRLDVSAIKAMLEYAGEATRALNAECAQLTNGQVMSPGTEVAKLMTWLGETYAPASEEHVLRRLAKDDVRDALKREDLPSHVRRVLELRQLAAKSSVKKLKAMLNCLDDDNAVRGVLAYYGASRTGRWAGRLIQPQNFPRPTIKRPNAAIEFMVRKSGKEGHDTDGLEMLFAPTLDVLASCLRGVLVPRENHRFVVYDLSQIEARMLAWIAGQNDVLDVFRRGEDVYVYAQQKIGLNSRQEGKVAVLGLGYGMGPNKFIDTALTYGLTFTPQRAEEIVSGWRENNPDIVSLWWDTDRKIKNLIRAAHVSETLSAPCVEINRFLSAEIVRARNGSPLLLITLPSGRRLFYREIALERETGAEAGSFARESISYMGVDQKTRKWSRVRTYGAKLVENIVQAASRDVIVDMALEIDTKKLGALVLSVHDELIVEVPAEDADARFTQIGKIMNAPVAWAPGLPVAAEGHVMSRYGKG